MMRRDSIHVWRVGLEGTDGVSPGQFAARWDILSLEEREKAEGFKASEHRSDYVTAHAALRLVLGRYLGVAAERVDFRSRGEVGGEWMKPALQAGSNASDLRFNLSHTQGAALISVAVGREVGADIEWQRPLEDLEDLGRSVMSEGELAQWLRLGNEERLRAFYHLWTRKESYLKAIGLGLYRSLQEVSVPVSVSTLNGVAGDARKVRDIAVNSSWMVTDIPVEGPYSASVCFEGAEVPELRVADLDWSELDGGEA